MPIDDVEQLPATSREVDPGTSPSAKKGSSISSVEGIIAGQGSCTGEALSWIICFDDRPLQGQPPYAQSYQLPAV